MHLYFFAFCVFQLNKIIFFSIYLIIEDLKKIILKNLVSFSWTAEQTQGLNHIKCLMGPNFRWKRGHWVHQNTSPGGKNETSCSSQNRDQPVTGTQTVQTGRGGGGLLTGQSEMDQEGMERRERHSLPLLLLPV